MRRAYLCGLTTAFALAISGCGGGGGGGGSVRQVASNSNSTGSGTGTLTAPPTVTGNSMPIVLDAGPPEYRAAHFRAINMPYVSVTVCTPGTTTQAACQTIDHVHLDTASYGLRLLKTALSSAMNLPAVTDSNGAAIGDCGQFADGYTWGSVRSADIYLAGEVARSVSIQDIGDHPGGAPTSPTDCASYNGAPLTAENTAALLGANGILGVGPFTNDCDVCLTRAIAATYYACTGNGCSGTAVTSAQVIKNPVALLEDPTTAQPQDNNGVLIDLPAVPNAGATSLAGSLIFGIGTQANNALNGATVYPADPTNDTFTTNYKLVGAANATAMSGFIDSGSNGIFFTDSGIQQCAGQLSGFYCPTVSPLSLSATNVAVGGAPSTVVYFSLVRVDTLAGSVIAANIGGSSGTTTLTTNQFDWGIPFFFGRRVFTGIAEKHAGVPYFAY